MKPQRQPLTMGNQESEMKSQYTGRPVMSLETKYSSNIQPQIYQHHHTDGPLKVIELFDFDYISHNQRQRYVEHCIGEQKLP